MSGGGNQTTATRTTDIPQWYSNAAQGYLGAARQVSELPWENYQGQRVAGLSPMQQYGMQGLGNLAGGTPYTGAAGNMLTETLNGGGMNPYMTGVANRVTGDASRAYQDQTGAVTARFNRPGSFGGSAHMNAQDRTNEAFARGMGDSLASNVYMPGYESERGRQMQAAGLAPGLFGAMGQGYQNAMNAGGLDQITYQRLLDSQYGDFNDWRNYPNQQLGIYGNAIRNVGGNTGGSVTESTPGPSGASQALGWLSLLFGNNGQRSY